jgi:hypothetical protein
MSVVIPQPSPRWSIPLVVIGVAVVIAFFVVLYPPDYRGVSAQPRPAVAEAQGGGEVDDGTIPGLSDARVQVVPPLATVVAPEQRARSVLVLKTGPDDRYVTVGQISSGSRVEVVGRSEKGDWLAISLTPGSKIYGWVRSNGVAGVVNVSALPVMPVKLLP